eukprot:CAMPEP_0171704752 /NCGR_PEP_ID=MMETSP0991-20121206/12825_1 /TAXON_ID=483369 /ORGANISM="non described non described, Strain CCMP2098" /LENGTH=41 /DNA_ID= /DNA_START= /DNA_END= /DNA_ORIENTATION=
MVFRSCLKVPIVVVHGRVIAIEDKAMMNPLQRAEFATLRVP